MSRAYLSTNNIVNDGLACIDGDHVIYNEGGHLVVTSVAEGSVTLLAFDGYFLSLRYPYVYFALKTDGFSLFRYCILTGERVMLANGPVKWVQVVDDTVYYAKGDASGLFAFCVSSGTTRLLLRQDCNYLCVAGNTIYFSNWSRGKTLWSYSLIKHEAHEVLSKDVAWINAIDEDTLVFRSWHNRKTYTLHIAERTLTLLNADGANYLHYNEGYIYYANMRLGGLWRQSVLDRRNKSCIWGGSARRINTAGDFLLFQDDNKRLVSLPIKAIRSLPTLRYIEMIVTTECTVGCANCSNGIPHAVKRTIAYDDFCRQLQLLLNRVSYIERFQVHGGEPFLNPDLYRIISILNGSQKLLNIRIATNGTIVPDEKTLHALSGSRIELAITAYPFNKDKREQLVSICRENNIHYLLYGEQEWYAFDSTLGKGNNFATCPINSYPCYYDGRVYLCSRICHLYSKKYPSCYIDLNDFNGDLAEVMDEMRLKVPCRECTITNRKVQAGT